MTKAAVGVILSPVPDRITGTVATGQADGGNPRTGQDAPIHITLISLALSAISKKTAA